MPFFILAALAGLIYINHKASQHAANREHTTTGSGDRVTISSVARRGYRVRQDHALRESTLYDAGHSISGHKSKPSTPTQVRGIDFEQAYNDVNLRRDAQIDPKLRIAFDRAEGNLRAAMGGDSYDPIHDGDMPAVDLYGGGDEHLPIGSHATLHMARQARFNEGQDYNANPASAAVQGPVPRRNVLPYDGTNLRIRTPARPEGWPGISDGWHKGGNGK